jgi:hypothetical protein
MNLTFSTYIQGIGNILIKFNVSLFTLQYRMSVSQTLIFVVSGHVYCELRAMAEAIVTT